MRRETLRISGPLQVTMLATTLPAAPGDGTPEFVLTMAEHLPDSEITIVAPRTQGCPTTQRFGDVAVRRFAYAPGRVERLADDAIMPTLRTDPATWLQVPGLLVAMLREAVRAVRSTSPDLVVAHWIIPGGLIARWVARRRGVPYVVVAHGADTFALTGRLGSFVKRRVLRDAAGVHAVSREIADRLELLVPGCVTVVEPMGVDVDSFGAIAEARHPEPGQVLFIGRLAEKKGVDILVRALARIGGDWRLEILGDGPTRTSLEALAAELGVVDRVDVVGRTPRAQVAEALATASVVVLPSKTGTDGDRDGTPVVLMEAMAAGVPVIVSEVGGMADYVEDGVSGTVVPEGDVEALAAALLDVLTDADAARVRAEAARGVARDQLDVASIGQRLRETFQRLVATAT